jgi:hypothetical protein
MANAGLIFKVAAEVLGAEIFDDFADNYQTRLLIQITMYLFQEAAKKDMFGYSWYVAGPYSPNVANTVYHTILPNLDNARDKWNAVPFSDKGKERIEKVKAYLCYDETITAKELDKAGFYELMASMLYQYHYARGKDETKERLRLTKGEKFDPRIIEDIINNYWDRLQTFVA